MPDEVPLMTRNGFQLLIPLLVVMLSISVMNAILLQTTGRIVPELISEAVRPLVLASDTLMAVLISLFICNLLWFIGIHGALIITGIMNPFWMTYLFENQQALAAGSPTLPHIYLQGFWDFYLLIGGIGSTLPLVLMAMRSRSRQLKSVAKIGLLPSLFNINEPILFGFPVIMNPVFFTAVSLCSADKCLYRMVFNSAGYPRPRGGDAAMVDAFPAGGGMVGERQLEKFVHEPVRDV